MALNLTPEGLEIATQAWLAEWRRAWARRNPGKETPVLAWEDYSEGERHLMMRAVKAAIQAAQPANLKAVQERREA